MFKQVLPSGGESCQAELCHVSRVTFLQDNEKRAVVQHLIQFHSLTLSHNSSLSPYGSNKFNGPFYSGQEGS